MRPSAAIRARLNQMFFLARAKTQDIRRSADRAIVRMGRASLRRELLKAITDQEEHYLRMQQARQDAEEWAWEPCGNEEVTHGHQYASAKQRTTMLIDLIFDMVKSGNDEPSR